MVLQKTITLPAFSRGFHSIQDVIESEFSELIDGDPESSSGGQNGLCHLFLKHTSASLMIGEDWDASVKVDLENWINKVAPENDPDYTHTIEGSDDMPAHIKNMIIGTELTIPVTEGRLNLGQWQGIYLVEHRNGQHQRQIVMTTTF